MVEHLYKLLWRLDGHPEGFPVEVARAKVAEGFGACDAVLLASIIYPADGSLSILFIGIDGRKDLDAEGRAAELDDVEWWKVWSMLASRLSESTTLSEGKKKLCWAVIESIRLTMKASRDSEPGEPDPE